MHKICAASLLLIISMTLRGKAPQLTVICIIDQFSAHYLPKLKPFFTGALKELPENGIFYKNAFFDHAMPGTGPGHTLLATGTFGSFHGIVNNSWFDKQGKKVYCDDDTIQDAAVFKPDGTLQEYGKSARNTLVDTLSDQLIMHSYPHATNKVWALSLKSRAAIAMAGHLGKALWFDNTTGAFTSSKAYFNELPSWIQSFNASHNVPSMGTVTWQPFFSCDSPAYHFGNINNYMYSFVGESIIGKPLPVFDESYDTWFTKTPQANQLLLDLGIATLEQHFSCADNERFILWLSLSSLDKAGHVFGPQSKEAIDLLYHIDQQLNTFIQKVHTFTDPENILFILTGDHGVQPIPELLKDQGLSIARRYHYPNILSNLNKLIEKKYCIKDIIENFKEPQLYLKQSTLNALTNELKNSIYQDMKAYLLDLPGIRRAWTCEELQQECFADWDLDKYLQRQLYQGRSGQILYAVNPYTHLDTYYPQGTKGTSHITEFAYDTQVPLIVYQQGTYEKQQITRNVYMPQVSVSLATLFDVPRPSAAAAEVLSELFTQPKEKHHEKTILTHPVCPTICPA